MSVEGVEGIFCVDGSRICIANVSDGACPPKQVGLEFGSYCGLVATKVYGCKTLNAQSVKTFQPGATPAPTTVTPAVAPAPKTTSPVVTGKQTSVVPATTSAVSTAAPHAQDSKCANGESEMSVEGVNGIFCVKGGPLCAADVRNGLCPGVEKPRLPFGSYCGVVASGVYGCKVATVATATTPPVTPAPTTVAPATVPVTVAVTPAPTTVAPVTVTPGSASPVTPAPTTPVTPANPSNGEQPIGGTASIDTPSSVLPLAPGSSCPVGESDVSVEGVKGFFCVVGGPICAGNIIKGLCPGKSDRLPLGSYCGVVASGVYGCKIQTSQSITTVTPSATPAPTTKAPTPTTTAPTASIPTTPVPSANATTTPAASSPVVSAECPNGGSPMSVEGCTKIFCVTGVPCAGNVFNGTCPTANAAMGLPKGSFCTIVRPGVYGYKPIV